MYQAYRSIDLRNSREAVYKNTGTYVLYSQEENVRMPLDFHCGYTASIQVSPTLLRAPTSGLLSWDSERSRSPSQVAPFLM